MRFDLVSSRNRLILPSAAADFSAVPAPPSGSGSVPTIVISPYTHRIRDGTSYTHYSLLRTTEGLLGLPLLGKAAGAASMRGKFGF